MASRKYCFCDSGSMINIIDAKTANEIGLQNLRKTDTRAKAFGGNTVAFIGCGEADIVIAGKKFKTTLFVCAKPLKYVMLGFRIFWNLGPTSFDVRRGRMVIGNKEVELFAPPRAR